MLDASIAEEKLDTHMDRPGRTTFLGLLFVSAALLHLEIALTKIFSIVLWYHFGFLAIGVALLGFATAGVYLTFRPTSEGAAGRRILARRALFSVVGIFVGFLLLTHSQFDTFSMIKEQREALFLLYLLEAALPFFLIGVAIAATITAFPKHVGSLYAANLTGSALGCITAVIALNTLTGQEAVMVSVALAGLGALLYAVPAGIWPLVRGVVVVGLLTYSGFQYSGTLFRLLPIPSKMFASVPPQLVEVSDWSSLAKVDILAIEDTHQGLWGISDAWNRDPWIEKARKLGRSPFPRRKGILIDEWAITSVLNPGGPFTQDNPNLTCLKYLPAGAVHRIKNEGSIVCIGAGGGLDVATALYYGKNRVVGVEINATIVDAMTGKQFAEKNYPEFSGNLYQDKRVHAVAAEGRHYLERTEEKFDIVQLSGVDTHSATQAGAFSLAENFLYTVEAFEAYFKRLKPGGVLTLTRWMLLRENLPTQSLRLFTLACEGLRRVGVEDPGKHIYYFRSGIFTIILVSLDPFTEEALTTLDKLLEDQLYDPLHRPHRPAPDKIAIRILNEGTTVEIPNVYAHYLQALRQGPAAVEQFHADYDFNVRPPTDDRPFFFEDQRFSKLWQAKNLINPLGGLSSHATLVLLFLAALLGGFLFLYLPVRRLTTLGITGGQRGRIAGYFGALGLAYLLVEIPLSQQFILFLGHPAYALTVILFSLLVFSGMGSLVAGRIRKNLTRHALLIPLTVAVVSLAFVAVLPFVLNALLPLSLGWRVALSVALLSPLGFMMGFPFPLGIRLLEQHGHGNAVPWAWAMNGYGSVLASVGAVILGISLGFSWAVMIGAGCYAVAGLLGSSLSIGGRSREA